ncbi:MAG: 2-dehydro-3-deoxyphosphogluconate aldolase/(4S)-4-hydroxy-2-oxoglutarate aldolase [Paraglaciecola psychrophila]|jgi:2-dehydro-3-deoxyphosphogluconate aldolase/(4S)-4-hydroxy-2-oxoglutarate aldolase
MNAVERIMRTAPVIPVIVIDRIEDAVPLARALVAGGLTVLEVTLRTACALQAISEIKRAIPAAVVGAGTVISPEDVDRAVAAGAEFLVSPGSTPGLIDAAVAKQIPILPGVATPSEAMALAARGLSQMKFFPAQAAGGVAMLKAISGPLPSISFCPTGGITKANAPDFLVLDNVLCVGGTWMLDKAAIAAGDWENIERQARLASQL